jgi:murein DD-endopeptidase MepM/ murein hydrolase activator NlpD
MRRLAALVLVLTAAASPPWTWPTDPPHIARPYVAPAHEYATGHRGIDLTAEGDVRAPDDGVVAFAGPVVDRAVLTIDHGDGVVSTLEPVRTELVPGTAVRRGEVVGRVEQGGHAAAGTVHLGARVDGAYVNPLLFLGGVPRAVLLPCC